MTGPRAVVLAVDEERRLADVATSIGLHLTEAPGAGRAVSRPAVVVHSGEIAACLLGCTDDAQPLEVRMIAGPSGLVALVPEPILARVRQLVEAAPDPIEAFVEVLMLLAASWEDVQEEMVDVATQLSGTLGGMRSSEPRRRITKLRAQLLASRHRTTAQARLLEPSGELFGVLPDRVHHRVDRARNTLLAAGSTASQTYQMLGDVLTLQATTISERLTLVSVLFLPLTVITGFFGMNFGWLVGSIAGPPAFWLLGVAFPLAIVLGTIRLIRWMGVAEE